MFTVSKFIGGLPGFFSFENFIKFLAERDVANGVLAFWDGLNFSSADDGCVDVDFPIIHIDVFPSEGEAFAEAHAGMVSESYRHIELMARWEFFKDCGELGRGEDSGFFGSLVVVRDLDDGSGVGAKVVVHIFCPREGFFENRAEGDKGAVTVFFFPGIEKVLKKPGGYAAQFYFAKGGGDVVGNHGPVNADGVGAEVDFDVFRQPFGKIFGDGHVGRLRKFTGLVDFGHSGAIGAFTFLLCYAADAFDAFSFAGFVFDFDAVVPFFPALVAVHGYSSFLFG